MLPLGQMWSISQGALVCAVCDAPGPVLDPAERRRHPATRAPFSRGAAPTGRPFWQQTKHREVMDCAAQNSSSELN